MTTPPNKLRRTMSSPYSLAVLAGLYPTLFFLAHNWFILGLTQSVLLAAVLVGVSTALIAAVNLALGRLLLPSAFGATKVPHPLRRVLLCTLAVYLLIGYFHFAIEEFQKGAGDLPLRSVLLGILGALLIGWIGIAHWGKRCIETLTPLNYGLTILTLLTVLQAVFFAATNAEKLFQDELTGNPEHAELYERIRFVQHPNIYLIVPDSYPSNPVLERFFDFNNVVFSKDLRQRGFRIYDNYYASYPYSVEGMHSMLAMVHNRFQRSVANDAVNLREVLTGKGSALFKVLRSNGYRSQFVHETDYLLKDGCNVERCSPGLSTYQKLRQNLSRFYFFTLPDPGKPYDVEATMRSTIETVASGDKRFVYKHFMTSHSGVKSYAGRYTKRLPDFRRKYPKRITETNGVLLNNIDQIIEKDPSAFIIIASDHGTWAAAPRTSRGLTPDETQDKFNVFLAMRWGPEYDGKYDDKIKTSVNLFRFVLAHLSQDELVLDTLEPDDAYLRLRKIWKVIEDGNILLEAKAQD